MPTSLLTVTPLTASGISHVGFLPSQLTGLVAWFDASQITTLSSGQSIPSWFNGSLDAAAVSAATNSLVTEQPLWIQNSINGYPAASFAHFQFLKTSSATVQAQPFSYFVVSSNSSFLNNLAPIGEATSGGWALFIRSTATTWAVNAGANLDGSTSVSVVTNSPTLIYGLNNGNAGAIRINGGSTVTGNTSTNTFAGICIGSRGDNPFSFSWIGLIAEIIFLNRAASAIDIASTESYLKTKYAIS